MTHKNPPMLKSNVTTTPELTYADFRFLKYVLTDEYKADVYDKYDRFAIDRDTGVFPDDVFEEMQVIINANLNAFNNCTTIHEIYDACQRWSLTDIYEDAIQQAREPRHVPAPDWII